MEFSEDIKVASFTHEKHLHIKGLTLPCEGGQTSPSPRPWVAALARPCRLRLRYLWRPFRFLNGG